MVPADYFSTSTFRFTAIFLGLLSASILPTLSLVINGLGTGSLSVMAITELKSKVDASVSALLFILGLIGLLVLCLAIATLDLPTYNLEWVSTIRNQSITYQIDIVQSAQRVIQGLAAIAFVMLLRRSGQIPAILRDTADARFKVALRDAEMRLSESAPSKDQIATQYPTSEDFGRSRQLKLQTTPKEDA